MTGTVLLLKQKVQAFGPIVALFVVHLNNCHYSMQKCAHGLYAILCRYYRTGKQLAIFLVNAMDLMGKLSHHWNGNLHFLEDTMKNKNASDWAGTTNNNDAFSNPKVQCQVKKVCWKCTRLDVQPWSGSIRHGSWTERWHEVCTSMGKQIGKMRTKLAFSSKLSRKPLLPSTSKAMESIDKIFPVSIWHTIWINTFGIQ